MYRGTTPQIKYVIPFNTDIIESAYVTVSQNNVIIMERSLNECYYGSTWIIAEFSQEETLKLAKGKCLVQLRVKTVDGTAYATPVTKVEVADILKDGVI